jgi:hypothetical protein
MGAQNAQLLPDRDAALQLVVIELVIAVEADLAGVLKAVERRLAGEFAAQPALNLGNCDQRLTIYVITFRLPSSVPVGSRWRPSTVLR